MGLNGPLSFYSLCGQIYSKRVRLCVFDVRCIKYYKWNIQWNQGLWLSGYGGGGWGKRRGFDRNMGFVCTYSNTRTQAHQKDFAFVGLVTCVGYSRDPRDQLYVIKYSWLAMTPRSIICIHILEREKMKKKTAFRRRRWKYANLQKKISYSTQRTWTIFFLIHKHFSKASNTCYFCVHPHIQSTYMADVVAMPQTFDICFLYVSVLIYSVYVLQCIWSFIAIHFFSIFFFLSKCIRKLMLSGRC